MDSFQASSSSRIAAGIINPITGKRLVKSWKIDELLPFAVNVYRSLEQKLGISFFHSAGIYNYFSNKEDLTFYQEKKDSAELKEFIRSLDSEAHPFVDNPLGGIVITRAFQLNIALFISSFRSWLLQNSLLREEPFSHTELELACGKAFYRDIEADRIIFCEGSMGLDNPYFGWLPFNPVKGEILTVRIKELRLNHILKKGVFILPVGKDIYKIGSTYEWNYKDDQPTKKGRQELAVKLQKALHLPFEILDHQAAIRPSVKDRRPLLGLHPDYPQLAIFNGLGTKGASLAPFFANHLSNFLVHEKPLDAEVDIQRFISNFPKR